MIRQVTITAAIGFATLSLVSESVLAHCDEISFQQLSAAADFVKNTASEQALTGGLKNNMWVTMVDESGKVCNVVNTAGSGQNSGATWGLSRVISAQKANTSAMLSLDTPGVQAWASGALYLATQPVLDPATGLVAASVGSLQGTLWGVQFSNPVATAKAYAGSPAAYGTALDPMVNKRIGGIIVFGGGLPLYDANLKKIGAIGVSGDTSCTDHAFAWRVRERLASSNSDLANAAAIGAANGGVPEVLDITGKQYPGCSSGLGPTPDPAGNGIK